MAHPGSPLSLALILPMEWKKIIEKINHKGTKDTKKIKSLCPLCLCGYCVLTEPLFKITNLWRGSQVFDEILVFGPGMADQAGLLAAFF